jgi:catechol 2,3-dioxygenase-like lactoylglutathione lyase family enzyme
MSYPHPRDTPPKETIMFDHIGVRVEDLDASVRFYQAALDSVGYAPGPRGEDYAGFAPPDQPAFYLHAAPASAANGAHVAFLAPDRKAVERFYYAGLDAGGRDNGKPGLRPDYGENYFAAFLIDLDGNNIEAVCYV